MIRYFILYDLEIFVWKHSNQEASRTTLTEQTKYIYIMYIINNFKDDVLFITSLLPVLNQP